MCFCFVFNGPLICSLFFPEQFDMGDVLIAGKPTGMFRRQISRNTYLFLLWHDIDSTSINGSGFYFIGTDFSILSSRILC